MSRKLNKNKKTQRKNTPTKTPRTNPGITTLEYIEQLKRSLRENNESEVNNANFEYFSNIEKMLKEQGYQERTLSD